METIRKVGDPDPSCSQGYPGVSTQQLGGGLSGSQGQWMCSGSMFLKQGLSVPGSAGTEGTCDSASQAPYSIQQPLQNPAEVSFQAGYEQDYQDPPRFFFTSQFTNPIRGAHMHGTMESETPILPMYKCSDTTSNTAQKRSYRSRLQELVAGQSKTPAKVLVGCGRGLCSPSQTPTLGFRKSRWLLRFPPGEGDSAIDQEPLPVVAQDQEQSKGPDLLQAPSTPTQVDTSAPEKTLTAAINL